jgi:HD-GYP domain-containing protein (c-di-GMP phosphodiesterase class II)
VMVAVAHAVDHRNPVTQGHSSRVAAIAASIGRHSNIGSSQLEDLQSAAFLHDVGHMTMTSGGSAFEVAGHAEAGEAIVAGASFPADVAAGVRHHHSRWDGGSQPEGMIHEDIPLLARILAVVERFEALTAGRECRQLTPQEALDRVAEGSGSEFDPAVVASLIRCVRDGSLDLNPPALALPATVAT